MFAGKLNLRTSSLGAGGASGFSAMVFGGFGGGGGSFTIRGGLNVATAGFGGGGGGMSFTILGGLNLATVGFGGGGGAFLLSWASVNRPIQNRQKKSRVNLSFIKQFLLRCQM